MIAGMTLANEITTSANAPRNSTRTLHNLTFKMFVTAVTKGRIGSGFASAENDSLLFCKSNGFRKKTAFAMIAITKRLLFRIPAGAPRITTGFNFDRIRVIVVFV